MTRKPYPSDLTDAQWEELVPLPAARQTRGHPRTVDLREVTNGILYVLRSGCSWRMLPHDLTPLAHRLPLLPHLASGRKLAAGPRHAARHAAASPGPRDQPQRSHHRQPPVKTTEKRGPRGYDAGKKMKGRKRHIVVDTPGDCCWQWQCIRQTFRTETAPDWC